MKQIEDLYIAYKQDVYGYLLSLTQDPVLSEDLLSETFVKAISSIRNFKGQSSVKTWLFSIARHLWLQNIRGKKQTVEYSDLLEAYVSGSTEEHFITTEIVGRISELLEEKDEKTKKVVNMRIEGFSYSEIAQLLKISESSARVVDFRTKRRIEDVLEKEGLI